MSIEHPAHVHVLLALMGWDELRDLAASCVSPPSGDELQRRWREARTRMHELADRESGCADQAPVLALPEIMAAHAGRVTASPRFAVHFARIPVALGLVEIDSLMTLRPMLWQDRLSSLGALAEAAATDDEALIRMSLPLDVSVPALRARFDTRGWQVVGEDETLGVLGGDTEVLADGTVKLSLVVGGTAPVMHVARWQGRQLLVNGAHRARALRARGVTYAPCLISACEDLDDVASLCPWAQRAELAEAFESPRPAMLRDHDRRSLVLRLQAQRRQRQASIRLSSELSWLP